MARRPTRWQLDNEIPLNPWAFVAVAALVLSVAGLALLLALL